MNSPQQSMPSSISTSLPPFFPPFPTDVSSCPQTTTTLQPRIEQHRNNQKPHLSSKDQHLYLSSSSSSAFSSLDDEDYDPISQTTNSAATSGGGVGEVIVASSNSSGGVAGSAAEVIIVSNMEVLRNLEYSASIDEECVDSPAKQETKTNNDTDVQGGTLSSTSTTQLESSSGGTTDNETLQQHPLQHQHHPQPSSNINISNSKHWKMKRRLHHHRRRRSSNVANETDNQGNTTHDDDDRTTSPASSNLFLEMGDEEVGNHSNTNNSTCDIKSYSTAPTATTTSNSTASSSGLLLGKSDSMSLQGSHSTPGVVFHPHSALVAVGSESVCSQTATSASATSATTDEYNNNCYYRTPIRMMGGKMIGSSNMMMTNAASRCMPEQQLKSSPQSVMDKLTGADHFKFLPDGDGGGACAGDDDGVSPRSPPREAKYSFSLLQHDSNDDTADGDGTGDEDDEGTDDSIAEEGDDDDEVEASKKAASSSSSDGNNPTKNIFSVSSIPLVDKFHDFITGNACWSAAANASQIGHGTVVLPSTMCADGNIIDMVEDVLPSLSTDRRNKVAKKKTKTKTNRHNYDEEEVGSIDEGYDDTSNDEETTTSNYTSEDSSRSGRRHHNHHYPRQNKQMMAKKKKGGSTKKLPSRDSPRRRRRGRSCTSKPGYNSDGESIRRGSSGSRPRGMRPSSSTSHTTSTNDDADFGSVGRGMKRRKEKMKESRYSASSDSSVSSALEVMNADVSVSGGGGSIMESVLSYDQATWMSMTQTESDMNSRDAIDGSSEMNGPFSNPASRSKKVDATEGYFKVCLETMMYTNKMIM
jgi:hypothetical protein